MDDYAGRVLADRYRLPLPPSDEYELVETRAFDTYSGQEVLVRQVPLPEVVDAEVIDAEGVPAPRRAPGRAPRRATDPAVRRAIEAAQSAAQIPDHPRLDQVFDVFAEGGSLWIVSELIAARPLAALLAEKPLNPYRAAEIASDVLTAVRVVHAHGWTHRNITVRTVLVCDDGRVVLTGLAAGAAEEALCGYAPVPEPPDRPGPPPPGLGPQDPPGAPRLGDREQDGPRERLAPPEEHPAPEPPGLPYDPGPTAGVPGRAALGTSPYADGASSGTSGAMPRLNQGTPGIPAPYGGRNALPGASASGDIRAARAGAIAAYRAGARAAARASEDERSGDTGELPAPRAEEAPEPAGPPPGAGPDPEWWARPPHSFEEPDPDERDDPDEDDDPPVPYRARLAGTWRDGPAPWSDGSAPVPAGGGSPYGPGPAGPPGGGSGPTGGGAPGVPAPGDEPGRGGAPELPPGTGAAVARAGDSPYPAPGSGGWGTSGADALRADARRQTTRLPAVPGQGAGAGRWDEVVASGSLPAYRGPATPLAAERARQARIAVVGAVTERWAPEQAGPVHENWQLAPPIGPSTDLWALGALLYRAVQGHAPYPEENAAELVQLVVAEPPAFAEECGPLRPVVESLLRQDPTERPDFEELRGWLRSLVRSAPEPEAGLDVVPLPSVDETRLPIVRRRGELVRRRRGRGKDMGGRHRHKKGRAPRREKGGFDEERRSQQYEYEQPRYERRPEPEPYERPARSGQERERRPRSLGRNLLVLILLLLVGAIVYAVMFMPKTGTQQGAGTGEASPGASAAPESPAASDAPGDSGTSAPRTSAPAASAPPVDLGEGYALRQDTEGFRIAVDKDWQRRPINDSGQVRYVGGDFTLIVVPGRDTVADNGADPMEYQRGRERELQPFRDSSWSTASGLRRIDVGRQAMAEGQFTWQDSSGREVYVRNLAMIIDGRYHIIQVIGPDSQRDKVSEIYQQASDAYRFTG
ncbi:serine/threonine protein kinase [Streptomyces sp. NPDC006923]|uniref:serine/threonine protein kinase n=1 Tax=Streptomyces sp. NPDC006923 TaxID=3155355 RepID=UPI0033E85D43